MSAETPTYQVGDVANGHLWDGTAWVPVEPAAMAGAAPQRAKQTGSKTKRNALIGGGALLLVIAAISVGGSDGGNGSAAPAPADGAAAAPAAPAGPAAPAEPAAPAGIGSGMHVVGVDIQPGLYVTSGSGYWERLSDASGEFAAILANGNGSGGQVYVEVLPGDAYFSTTGFDDWVPADQAPAAAAATSFDGSGMFRVGADIEPGTYSSSGGGYWARLSGATGDFTDIIANDNPDAKTVVTIAPGDAFFETSGNGEWVKVS
jgi:hypothetical protein